MSRARGRVRHGAVGPAAVLAALAAGIPAMAQSTPDLGGVWAADEYHMAEGGKHRVEGRIFFGARDWQVLFFVMDDSGQARRGSAEGGSYSLTGDRLVFTHLYNLSVGDQMPGLPAQDLRMIVRSETDAPEEPTQVEVSGDGLTLFFPSGNRMTFRRR